MSDCIGYIFHHSACSAINGKGYDFYIKRDGTIIPSEERTDPDYIHICMEGNFSLPLQANQVDDMQQLFAAQKLLAQLAKKKGVSADFVFPHTEQCPGKYFAWDKLVISPQDGYH